MANITAADFAQPVGQSYKMKQEQAKQIYSEQEMEIHPCWFRKILPLLEVLTAFSTKKKHRHKVSQKAIEVTSFPYKSALKATRTRERESQNRSGNIRQKQ